MVPTSNPGEYDQDTGQAEFDRVAAIVAPPTEPSGSSSLTGPCGGFAYSYDGDGVLIDAAIDLGDDGPPIDAVDGGQAFTSDNPFLVDASGQVVYYGFAPRSGDGPQDHRYSIEVAGVEVASGVEVGSSMAEEVEVGEAVGAPLVLGAHVAHR